MKFVTKKAAATMVSRASTLQVDCSVWDFEDLSRHGVTTHSIEGMKLGFIPYLQIDGESVYIGRIHESQEHYHTWKSLSGVVRWFEKIGVPTNAIQIDLTGVRA